MGPSFGRTELFVQFWYNESRGIILCNYYLIINQLFLILTRGSGGNAV